MAVSVPSELRRDAPSFHRHQYNVERRIPRRRQNDSTDSPDPDSSSSRADHCSGLLRARMHARPSPRCYAAGRLLGARYPGRIPYAYDGFLKTGVTWSGPVPGSLSLGFDPGTGTVISNPTTFTPNVVEGL